MNIIEQAIAPFAPSPRRHAIEQGKHGVTIYGPWRIYFDPPPIPTRNCDWHWVHDDFDGAPDSGDNRCGSCASFADALSECDECDECEDEQP